MIGTSERERMLTGALYLASDPELAAARQRARALIRDYNATGPDEEERRQALLSMLFARMGRHIHIEPPFHCDYGSQIELGDSVEINFGCVILDCARVTIGGHVLVGPYVQILAATHPLDPQVRRTGRELAGPVVIGDDVWIGGGAILCPGVSIGCGTTIGAGSVVTRDLPGSVLAGGNPCRVIRKIG